MGCELSADGDPESHRLIRAMPMAGGDGYRRNSRMQTLGLLPGLALLATAADSVSLPEPSHPIVIADYGASSGGNSLIPMGTAIDSLRVRTNQPICVVHTDLPDNDFAALFNTVAEDPQSYSSRPDVFPMAIGSSFYRPILPDDSVTLGWSSWALAWLSRTPAPVPDHVHASYSTATAVRSAYARQAAEDWTDFLTARSREMRAGGRLVLIVPAADADGTPGYRPMFDAAWDALTGFVGDGLLSADEALRMGMPHFGRTGTDLGTPFAEGGGSFAGLTIEHLESFDGTDPFWDDFQSTGDAKAFGDSWAGVFDAGASPSLATGLDSGPDDARTGDILARLRTEVASRLAAAPQRMRIPVAACVLAKQ